MRKIHAFLLACAIACGVNAASFSSSALKGHIATNLPSGLSITAQKLRDTLTNIVDSYAASDAAIGAVVNSGKLDADGGTATNLAVLLRFPLLPTSGVNAGYFTPPATTNVARRGKVVFVGDSLTQGSGAGNATNTFPAAFAFASGMQVTNTGIPGADSYKIRTNHTAHPEWWGFPTVFWVGRNNYDQQSVILSDLSIMASNCLSVGNTNFLVLSVINSSLTGESLGQIGHTTITNLNWAFYQQFGPRYVNVRAHLVSLAAPGDSADLAADRPPGSLHSDDVHLNGPGYVAVAHFVYTNAFHILRAGWSPSPTYAEVNEIFQSPPPIGSKTPGPGLFTTIAAASGNVTSMYGTSASYEGYAVRYGAYSKGFYLSGDGSALQFDGHIAPSAHGTKNIGYSPTLAFQNGYFSGGLYSGSVQSSSASITYSTFGSQYTTNDVKAGTFTLTGSGYNRYAYLSGDGLSWQLGASFDPDATGTRSIGRANLGWLAGYFTGGLYAGSVTASSGSFGYATFGSQYTTNDTKAGSLTLTGSGYNRSAYLSGDGNSWQLGTGFDPDATGTRSIGRDTLRWLNAYLSGYLYAGTVSATNGAFSAVAVSGNVNAGTVSTPAVTASTVTVTNGVTAGNVVGTNQVSSTVYRVLGTGGAYKQFYLSGDNSSFQFDGGLIGLSDGTINIGYSSTQLRPNNIWAKELIYGRTLQSYATTGTAPLIVASTTEVANLRAATATALATPRTINGVSFDGTANITVPAAAATLTGPTLANGVTNSSLVAAAGGTFGTAAFTAAAAYDAAGAAASAQAASQPLDADLTAIAALTTTSFGRGLLDDADAAAGRTSLGLVIGTDVQAQNANLDDLADGTLSNSKLESTVVITTYAQTLTSKRVTPRAFSISFSNPLTIYTDSYDVVEVGALTGNITALTLAGTPTDGQTLRLSFRQDGTGGRVVTWPASMAFGTDHTSGMVPSAANAKWQMTLTYNAADSVWRVTGMARGF